jgi:ElaB/YqjD/DUF883 family membrane-anchored ribosome-binding protein
MAAAETGRATKAESDRSIDRVSQSAHEAVDRVTGAASQVADRLSEHAERITGKGEDLLAMKDDWVETAREYVREKPFAALGMAVAAGYLLHMITRSR